MYVSSFHFVSPCFVTSIFQNFWSVSSCSEFFLYILFVSFVTKQKWVYKKKDVCLIVSFCFILFCNKHWTSLLVSFILFQSFSFISYSIHLLRNRNGFIKKKMMYVSLFHFISLCFVMSIFQNFWSVSSCFKVFPIYLICFICYETEMGLYKKKRCYVSLFHFISPCFVTSIFQNFWSVSSCFKVFPIYLISFISYETEMGL